MSKQTALITGASAGIGLELARKFAEQGHNLVAVARREDRLVALKDELEKAHGITVEVIAADLADAEGPARVFAATNEAGLIVDILVNNAGFGYYGLFHETDTGRQMELIQVNVKALAHLTHLYLPGMVERGTGMVLNIASNAAFQAGPLQSCYYASKAFVLSFSQAISNELEGTGVTVTCYCPGPTVSEFHQTAGTTRARYNQGKMLVEVRPVVEDIYRTAMKGKSLRIYGMMNRILAFGNRLTPRSLQLRVVRKLQRSVDDS